MDAFSYPEQGIAVPCGSTAAATARERTSAAYLRERESLYRFLLSQGLAPDIAQDATQDVFVEMYVALQAAKPLRSERAWLFSVAAHKAADYWRDRRSRGVLSLDTSDSGPAPVSQAPLAEEDLLAKERLERVAAAIARLPRTHRACLTLRGEGLRYREIARTLGVATSTVSEWLRKAVEHVRGDLHG